MVRSASRLAPIALFASVAALAGCSTTQQTAARLRVNDARILASQLPTVVRGHDPAIEVIGLSLVRGSVGSALIVTLHNRAERPVSDLPISIGIIARHRDVSLNDAAGVNYFQSHIPAIAARGTLRWVFTTPRRLLPESRPFAVVGLPTTPQLSVPRTLPDLDGRPIQGLAALRGGELQLSVQNRSSLPQYQLPVYATATRDGRYVAAGEAMIAELGGGAVAMLRLRLTGNADGASVSIQTPSTIFG